MPAVIQQVIVHRTPGMKLQQAIKICKDITGKQPLKVDYNEHSFRFRQIDPQKFKKFRAKALTKHITIIFGITPLTTTRKR